MIDKKLLDKDTECRVMYHIEEYLRFGNTYNDIESLCAELKKRLHDLESDKWKYSPEKRGLHNSKSVEGKN